MSAKIDRKRLDNLIGERIAHAPIDRLSGERSIEELSIQHIGAVH
jgi:hypothetical protein